MVFSIVQYYISDPVETDYTRLEIVISYFIPYIISGSNIVINDWCYSTSHYILLLVQTGSNYTSG